MIENVSFDSNNNTIQKEKSVLFNGKEIKEHYKKPIQANAIGKYKIEVFKGDGGVDTAIAENAFTDKFNLLPHMMFEHLTGSSKSPFGRDGFRWEGGLLFTTNKEREEFSYGNIPEGQIMSIGAGKSVFSQIKHNRGGALNTELSFIKRYPAFTRLNVVYDYNQECGNGIHKGIYYASGGYSDWEYARANDLLGNNPDDSTSWNLYPIEAYDVSMAEDHDIISQVIPEQTGEYQPIFKTLGKYEDFEYIGQQYLISRGYSSKYYYAKRDIETNEFIFTQLQGIEVNEVEDLNKNVFVACDTLKNVYTFKTVNTRALQVQKGTVNYDGNAVFTPSETITYNFPDDYRRVYMKVFKTYTIFVGVPNELSGTSQVNKVTVYRFANGQNTPADTWTITPPTTFPVKFASKTIYTMILNNDLYLFLPKHVSPNNMGSVGGFGYKLLRDHPESIAPNSTILKFDHNGTSGKYTEEIMIDQIEENMPIITRGLYNSSSSYRNKNVTQAFLLYLPISYTNLSDGFIEKTNNDTMRITYTLTVHHNFSNFLKARRDENNLEG